VENKIIIPLDGTESVEEVPLYATSLTPCGDTALTRLVWSAEPQCPQVPEG
jgi:hypothetical protein